MKSVMLSIHPKWCNLISNKQKTIEVRKNKPDIAVPFKCFVYCTCPNTTNSNEVLEIHSNEHIYCGNGKVIGEFICDRIDWYTYDELFCNEYNNIFDSNLTACCLTQDELMNYGKGKMLYGWHISEFKLYDIPKAITEFQKYNRECLYSDLGFAKPTYDECKNSCKECNLKRPPQSWCYVEEI